MYLILPTILVRILFGTQPSLLHVTIYIVFILVIVPFLTARGLWAIATMLDIDIVCSLAICSSEALVTIMYIVCTHCMYAETQIQEANIKQETIIISYCSI